MKCLITESQYNRILIEQTWGGWTTGMTPEQAREATKGLTDVYKSHNLMTVLQIGSAFIPFIGPLISTGLGLADAAQYYKEGDTKTAGLVALFSFIPVAGNLANKLGLSKWGVKAMGNLGKKISSGAKLTKNELEVANRVSQYKDLVLAEMKKVGQQAAATGTKQVAKKTAINQTLKSAAKTAGGYAAAGYGYSKGYDYVQRNTPKAKAEKEKISWANAKEAFGSSGSEQDNTLLNAAWEKGWRPGMVVPQQYQTSSYKQKYNEESQNIDKLNKLLAQYN